MHSEQFKQALMNKDLQALKRIPKADLHNHSGLGMRFETFKAYCQSDIPYPPSKMNGIEGMDDYMSKVTAPYVNDRYGFEFLLKATIEAAIEDGVTLLETSIDCGWLMDYDFDIHEFTNYIQNCVIQYGPMIDFRPEIGVFKGISENAAEKMLLPCIESSVFKSIDFYGSENWFQPELTKKYMTLAKLRGLKTKIHIGEFSDAASIDYVLNLLNPDELQHGITANENEELMKRLKHQGTRLNICPSSNVVLGAVPSIQEHPIRQLFDFGLNVTVNTDDLLFFHRTVSEEFLFLYESGVFTPDELDIIRLNALNSNK